MSRATPPLMMWRTIRSFCPRSSERLESRRLASGGTANTPRKSAGETGVVFISQGRPRLLVYPQNRLPNKKVPNHFFDVRICRQFLPKLEIVQTIQSDTGKQ